MGSLFGGRVSSGVSYIVNPTNPNPVNFEIIKSLNIGKLWVTLINYPNCTNYEGNKILVTENSLEGLKEIDPHFTKDSKIGLIARFEPSVTGWNLAKNLCTMLTF